MAERRPVTALEIRRDVEGYSGMNEDAFARRFYADRAELDVARHPPDASTSPPTASPSRRTTRCAPENFHLPAIAFTDEELAVAAVRAQPARRRVRLRRAAAPGAAADLLGPPEPARLARPALDRARHHRLRRRPRPLPAPGEGRDRDLPPQDDHVRLLHDGARRGRARARSTPTTCSSRAASSTSSAARTSATRSASSGSRASAARSPTRPRPSTTSSAPTTSTRASYATARRLAVRRREGMAEIWVSERIAWQVERHFGRYGEIRPARTAGDRSSPRRTPRRASSSRGCSASASTRASLAPDELVADVARARRADRRAPRGELDLAAPRPWPPRPRPSRREVASGAAPRDGDPARALRAPGHARVDPDPGRPRRRAAAAATTVCEALQVTEAELREDVNVLNVVNFGGGSYVLYAEVHDDGDDRGRPRAVLRQLRPPRAAAAGRGQGARRRDRPDRRPPARGRAELGAREDRRGARRRPDGAGPAGRLRRRRRLGHRPRRLARDRRVATCCASSTTRPTRTSSPSASSSPTR